MGGWRNVPCPRKNTGQCKYLTGEFGHFQDQPIDDRVTAPMIKEK